MAYRDPKTKEEIMNRMLQRDFNGDLAALGEDNNVILKRIKRHVLRLVFPVSGQQFDLTVHKPRASHAAPAARKLTAKSRVASTDAAPPAPAARKATGTRARMKRGNAPAHGDTG